MQETPSRRLNSWKEIAVYLGRDIRTVIRWEHERGLPVHRVPGGRHRAIFAYTQEIDAWLAGAQPAAGNPTTTEAAAADVRLSWLARIPRIVQAGLLTVLAIGLYAAVALTWKAMTSSPLASVTIRENKFAALDKSGRALWTYPLPAGQEMPQGRSPGITHLADLDGDGRKEVLVSLPYPEPAPAEMARERALYCFSHMGKLLWRFDFQETLTFGPGDYGPPWLITASLLYRAHEEPRIALVLHTAPWWPAVLLVLDPRGQEVGRFVNSGNIFKLTSMETPSGPVLLAGGVRNQEDEVSGMLAVLDGTQISGSSPEESGSRFECKSCPPGRPLRYFVFPRSELNIETLLPFNRVNSFVQSEDDWRATTHEVQDAESNTNAEGIFEFSRDFRLLRASYGDSYREFHRKLERERKMKHPWERCPDRFGPRLVRAWDPQHGWTELRPNRPTR